MVLLIPNAIRKIRADERKRIRAALAELGIREGQEPVTLNPDEVLKVLRGDADGSHS